MTPALFTPITLRDLTLPNRLWVAPMCQYSAVDGCVSTWHVMHHGAFASGGAGLIFAEATGVVPEGRISVGCPGMWSDATAASWRPVVDFVHSLGGHIGIQLSHAGRKGSRRLDWVGGHAEPEEGGWQIVGPSDNAYTGYPTARALTVAEIEALVGHFADAARRAVAVGFDAIELHAAHGYLLHQFLSPLVNERTDEYGGSFDNRVRFPLAVIRAVRAAIPTGMPLIVRLSATDWADGGWDLEQSIEFAKRMKEAGVDLVDVSTAGVVHEQQVQVGPGYQVPFATAIREGAGIPVSAVGLITEAEQANAIVEEGRADVVEVARAALRNPRWPFVVAEQLGHRPDLPPQLNRARRV